MKLKYKPATFPTKELVLLSEISKAKSSHTPERLLEMVTDYYLYTVKIENGVPITTIHGQGCKSITGYLPQDYHNDPTLWYSMIHDEDKQWVLEQLQRIYTGESIPPIEHRIVHRNGKICWVRNTIVPHYNEHGQLMGYDGLIYDITHHKETQVHLKLRFLQQEVVAKLGHMALSGYKLDDLMMKIVNYIAETLGTNCCHILEYLPQKEAFILRANYGCSISSKIQKHKKGLAALAWYTVNLASSVVVENFIQEKRFPTKKLRNKYKAMSGMSVLIGSKSKPFGVLEVYSSSLRKFSRYDLHFLQSIANILATAMSRKQAEEALKESEETFRYLFNNNPMPMWVYDSINYRILAVNEAMIRHYGYSEQEFLNMTVQDLLPEEEIPSFIKYLAMQDKNTGNTSSWRHRKKDGSLIIVEIYSHEIHFKGREAQLIIANDITERQKFEAELIKASKLESLSILAGGIAHDFNNLLTVILGSLSLINSYKDSLQKQVITYLNHAEKATNQAKDLTIQLLTFAKGGTPIKKAIKITEMIKDYAKFTIRGTNVKCRMYFAKDLWTVQVDEAQISQVIQNLIINAIQSMPEGGRVIIRGQNVTIKNDTNLPLRKGKYVKISIKDQGTGISEENLSKIFDPYFTTKKEGCGLGLATAYSIIKKHDGIITVDTKLNEGTTFNVYLPASPKNCRAAKMKSKKEITKGHGKILIMDDEDIVRNVAVEILKRLGYEVTAVKEGHEAIQAYQEALKNKQPYDVVIIDLTVPGGLGGKETIRELRKIDPKVKAVVSSGYSNDPIMSKYKDYGFSAVIAKPYRLQDLSEVLKKLLH